MSPRSFWSHKKKSNWFCNRQLSPVDQLCTSQVDNNCITCFDSTELESDTETLQNILTDEELLDSVDDTLEKLTNKILCEELDWNDTLTNVSFCIL